MHVFNNLEDSRVHLHQLDQCHSFSSKQLLEVDIENLCESSQDNRNLLGV